MQLWGLWYVEGVIQTFIGAFTTKEKAEAAKKRHLDFYKRGEYAVGKLEVDKERV